MEHRRVVITKDAVVLCRELHNAPEVTKSPNQSCEWKGDRRHRKWSFLCGAHVTKMPARRWKVSLVSSGLGVIPGPRSFGNVVDLMKSQISATRRDAFQN